MVTPNATKADFESFKFKAEMTGRTQANGNFKDVFVFVYVFMCTLFRFGVI